MASSVRVEAKLAELAIGLGLAHDVDALEALIIATRFSRAIFLPRLNVKKPTPSSGLHKVPMYAVHWFMVCDWRRVRAMERPRISGFWIVKRVDPGHRG